MEISKILSADVLDIIFEGRNKSYGAYELRKSYRKRLILSITCMLTVVLLLWAGYLLANKKDQSMLAKDFDIPDTMIDKYKEPEKELPPPPPPPKQEQPKIEMKKFTPPVIVNEEVPENEKPPVNTDLDDVRIGTVNETGDKDPGFEAPPADDGNRGIVEKPTIARDNIDSLFIKVEIESSYPGGAAAWTRFLVKNLSAAYPQEAVDQGIQGKVVIQFVVDHEGNVSNIEAISGPPELWEAAIKVIRKSGKWIPAEQNGRKVKSLKRQPVGFVLASE